MLKQFTKFWTNSLPTVRRSLLYQLWHGHQTISSNSERKIKDILKVQFPQATAIKVNDISGGCGAMFDISIESPEFQGLKMVKQHEMVNEALKQEIKNMHGLRIQTSVPS